MLILLLAGACGKLPQSDEAANAAKVSVTVTELRHGAIADQLTLFANTVYLTRNVVTAPIPAFITQVFIRLGDQVQQGQILYQIETKERRALGGQQVTPDSSLTSFGKIVVKASASGIISTLDKQQIGDYVLEGTQLCTLAESSALAFNVNVPFEFTRFTKTGMGCTIVLPDSSRYPATFTAPLTTMNTLAQTQTILAKSNAKMFLPENLVVKVFVNKNTSGEHPILPRASVLSDEMLKNFWVMKLINDTTAVKIPVILGNRNHREVEIIQPSFAATDKFLVTGNYGLPDTARVTVTKTEAK